MSIPGRNTGTVWRTVLISALALFHTGSSLFAQEIPFTATAIVAASDVDHVASAFQDGNLNQIEEAEDAISVVSLTGSSERFTIGAVSAPHSAVGWPQILGISPGGQRAYVVETRGSPAEGVSKVEDLRQDLPKGRTLTVVDIENRASPKVIQSMPVGVNLNAVAISPDGKWLAIGTEAENQELILAALENGLVTKTTAIKIEKADNEDRDGLHGVRGLSWHPSGKYIGANIADRYVIFLSVAAGGNGNVEVKEWGERLDVAGSLANGKFTPDGSFFLITDVAWGEGWQAQLFNPEGILHSIRFDEEKGSHEIVDSMPTGISPQGFDISPDGLMVATVNLNRTYLSNAFPYNLWPGQQHSTLNLFGFDARTGRFSIADRKNFKGQLAKDVVFDADSDALAVSIFHHQSEKPEQGFVGIWEIDYQTKVPELIETGIEIPLPRGVHDLAVVR